MSSASLKPDLQRLGREALCEVLGALLDFPLTEGRSARETDAESPDGRLQGTVKLTGPHVSGTVHLQLSRAFARHAVVHLVGATHPRPPGDAEVQDFAGELCNMLAGRVAAQLRSQGYPCELGVPEVVREPPGLPEPEPGTERGRTDWTCQGHRLALEMRLRYQPT